MLRQRENQTRDSQIYFFTILQYHERKMIELYGNLPLIKSTCLPEQQHQSQKYKQNIILQQNGSDSDHNKKNQSSTQSGQSGNQNGKISSNSQFEKLQNQVEKKIDAKQLCQRFKGSKGHTHKKNDEQYIPDVQSSDELANPKGSQSKNLPRIFGKNILLFVSRNRDLVLRLLQKHECPEYLEQFMLSVNYNQKHIGSIADFRNLWMNESNSFAKFYRILSKMYLRKHCLPNIFNSRIKCVQKHLKYRRKIEQSISNPIDFTNLKDY